MSEQSSIFHKTVLLEEAIQELNLVDNGVYVDTTFGGGGHTRKILETNKSVTVIALDWDQESLERNSQPLVEEFKERIKPRWCNFTQLHKILRAERLKAVNGILADFGTSQHQLKYGEGFSFMNNAPLDMRMSKNHGKTKASDIVNNASEKELTHIFFTYGEERHARLIARAIVAQRKIKSFKFSQDLSSLIEATIPRQKSPTRKSIHPATKIFQALRIVVNSELDNITALLKSAPHFLLPKSRFVCISFHSLEDRIVKHHFLDAKQRGELAICTTKPIYPSAEEIAQNPPSRSARMRVAEKLSDNR